MKNSIEKINLENYIQLCPDEQEFDIWMNDLNLPTSLILAEGFEERSLGIIKRLVNRGYKLSKVIIGQYSENPKVNEKYRKDLFHYANELAPNNIKVLQNINDGMWVKQALSLTDTETVVLDITALSNRGIFGALDSTLNNNKKIYIGYSEPIYSRVPRKHRHFI